MARHVAVKRLLADLKEVLEHPQADVAAQPLDDNLFEWHANLRAGGEGEEAAAGALGHLAGVPIHALLLFPSDYPTNGPEIRLFHALPHPNVAVAPQPAGETRAPYRVALWDCNPSLDQWNPAYSVASVLALLHSFLLDPALLYATHRISPEAARRAALWLDLQGHPHRGAYPFPPFPTREDAELAPRLRQVEVARPQVNPELMHALPDLVPAKPQPLASADDGWVAVVGGKAAKARVAVHVEADATAAAARAAAPAPLAAGAGGFALLAGLDGEDEPAEAEVEVEEEMLGAEEEAEEAEEGAPAAAAGGRHARKRLMDESILRAPQRSLIADVRALYRRRRAALEGERTARPGARAADVKGVADHRLAAAEGASAGPLFDTLTPDALAQVLLLMEARDVAALGATCRALRAAAADGEVWRALLRRAFPASPLTCASLADYRLAYQLEANGVVPELCCFYSRASFETEVLGFPYQFTVNPKSRQVDYIMVGSPDLVSVEAAAAGLVQRDAGGNAVQGVMPAYLTREHFERALPHLPAVLRQLCPTAGPAPGPEVWLTVLPTCLNTCVVLLCDNGEAASERALNTYCGLHRLLLALAERHALFDRAERRLQRFLSSGAHRTKAEAPSLGLLVPLLALSRRHDWRQVLPAVLDEALDRQVLWVCKEDRALVERYRVDPARGGVDPVLVEGAFKASRVALRLLMFHAAFLSLVARPPGQPIGGVMYRLDCLYGRPGAGLRRRFQGVVKRILECQGWDEALDLMGLLPLSPAAWTARLRQSWRNSLARGYHTPRTNFDRIQAGGVSRILLRGQRYSAPPNLGAIEVDERWHSCRRGEFAFLDASCLLYGRPRGAGPSAAPEVLEAVDFSRTRSRAGRGAVRHSGDIVEEDNGQHTISIDLKALPPYVEGMYLTMSSWAGARLTDIDQPFVRVTDPASGVELCQFFLEDVPAAERARHSSVLMLRVFRGAAAGRWEIEAMGQLGQGDASNYRPIEEWIERSLVAAQGARRR